MPSLILILTLSLTLSLSAGAAPTVLWSHNISVDSYWYGAVSGGVLYAGTFGLHVCLADALELATGRVLRPSAKGVCRVGSIVSAAGAAQFGGMGYTYPIATLLYNTSTNIYTHTLGGGFYPAAGHDPVVLREGEMLVWGDNLEADPSTPKLACMHHILAATGAISRGPCLTDYGDGEYAEVMSVSQDGNIALLSAGLKLIVVERESQNWTKYRERLRLTYTNEVFNEGALSRDGSVFAIVCAEGVCVYRYDASNKTYTRAYAVADVQYLDAEDVVLNMEADIFVVTYNDNAQARQWAVRALQLSSGHVLWTYTSLVSSGALTDLTASLSLSADGRYVAVGSWGDDQNLNPQVHVFQGLGGSGKPLVAHVCVGSVTYVHVESTGGRGGTVAVLGLQQHENQGVIKGVALALSF